jgi:NAD(P)-dependent dehydrogenase (short-subunit alcohol dehydrogenase family)
MAKMIALITGASSGFGRLIADALAAYARDHAVDLRALELDVQSETSTSVAIDRIIAEHGRLDIVVHNAGHMVWGPSEAFASEQLAELYDINVLGTQRVNRAALPHMREARKGLVIWVSSSSAAGGTPPLLGPYFAAKAGLDALAVCYARELAPFGIETSIVVPGAFTTGTNHFAHAGAPGDVARAAQYVAGLPESFAERMKDALAATVPKDADPAAVATAVVEIVNAPFGNRPFRVVIDPASDGAAVSFTVIDRVREEFLRRIGFTELLRPTMAQT